MLINVVCGVFLCGAGARRGGARSRIAKFIEKASYVRVLGTTKNMRMSPFSSILESLGIILYF